MKLRSLSALVLSLALAACGGASDGPTAPPPLTAGGTYTGNIGSQVMSFTLVENSGVVNGSGTITNTPTGTRAQVITGTFSAPKLTLTLTSGTTQPVSLSGNVTTTQFVGTLVGSGFTGEAIIMNRAP